MARKVRKAVLDRIVRDGALLVDQRQPGHTWRDKGHYFYHPTDIARWLTMEYTAALARMKR